MPPKPNNDTTDYKKWGLKHTANTALSIVTLGSESPDYLFKTYHELKDGTIPENACLSIAYMGEQIEALKNRVWELKKKNVKLRRLKRKLIIQ